MRGAGALAMLAFADAPLFTDPVVGVGIWALVYTCAPPVVCAPRRVSRTVPPVSSLAPPPGGAAAPALMLLLMLALALLEIGGCVVWAAAAQAAVTKAKVRRLRFMGFSAPVCPRATRDAERTFHPAFCLCPSPVTGVAW